MRAYSGYLIGSDSARSEYLISNGPTAQRPRYVTFSLCGYRSAIATAHVKAIGAVHKGAIAILTAKHPAAHPVIIPRIMPVEEMRRSITDAMTTANKGPENTPRMVVVSSK